MNTKLWKSCTIKRCSLLANGVILRILIVSLYGGHKNKNKLVSMYNHFLHTVILLDSFWIFFFFFCVYVLAVIWFTLMRQLALQKFLFLLFYKVIKMYGFQAGIWIFIFTKVKISLLVFSWWFGSKGRTSLWWLLSLIVRYSVL